MAELGPGFVPLRNRSNDYLIDRDDQKHRSFTGVRGIAEQDQMAQESQGFIADRTREHLSPTDIAVVRFRRVMLDGAKALARRQGTGGGASPAELSPALGRRGRARRVFRSRTSCSSVSAAPPEGSRLEPCAAARHVRARLRLRRRARAGLPVAAGHGDRPVLRRQRERRDGTHRARADERRRRTALRRRQPPRRRRQRRHRGGRQGRARRLHDPDERLGPARREPHAATRTSATTRRRTSSRSRCTRPCPTSSS